MNKKYNKVLLPIILACLLFTGLNSCKKYNDWKEDDSHSRLFSPVAFSATAEVIKVTLKWRNMPGTNGYTIELSEDSLVFANIVKTYSGGAAKDADGYSFVIPDVLKSNTRYSARIKGRDTTGSVAESIWTAVSFRTGTEQIMAPLTAANIAISSVTLSWAVPNDVSHIMIGANKYDISASEKAAGTKTITGLTGGTQYTAEIYLNNIVRGRQIFKTYAPNPSGANVKNVAAAADLPLLIAAAVPGTTLIIPRGAMYSYTETFVLPEGADITFWGEDGPAKPVLALNLLTLPANAGTIKFANLDLTGYEQNNPSMAKRNYIFNQSTATNTTAVIFDNCLIHNLGYTPFRLQTGGAMNIGKVAFNNCIIYDAGYGGNYAIVHNSVATARINTIEFTNSTAYKIGFSIIFHNASPSQSVLIDNCTFDNILGDGRYLIEYNAQSAGAITIRNTIIGKTLYATARGFRSTTTPVVANSFKTNDAVFASALITGISDYSKASTDLFTDPANANFLIKDKSFIAASTTGDPRWRP